MEHSSSYGSSYFPKELKRESKQWRGACETEANIKEVCVKMKASHIIKNFWVNVILKGINFHYCSVQDKYILTPSIDSRDKYSRVSALHIT